MWILLFLIERIQILEGEGRLERVCHVLLDGVGGVHGGGGGRLEGGHAEGVGLDAQERVGLGLGLERILPGEDIREILLHLRLRRRRKTRRRFVLVLVVLGAGPRVEVVVVEVVEGEPVELGVGQVGRGEGVVQTDELIVIGRFRR